MPRHLVLVVLATLWVGPSLAARQESAPAPAPAPAAPATPAPVLTPPTRAFPMEGGPVDLEVPAQPARLAAPSLRKASDLLGAPVGDSEDMAVGTVVDIVIDPQDGRIQFVAIAAPGDVGGHASGDATGDATREGAGAAAGRLLALAPDVMRCGPERSLELGVNRAALATAPMFEAASWPAPTDREWIEKSWRHFGLTPYWNIPPAAGELDMPAVRLPRPSPSASEPDAPAWRSERLSRVLHAPVSATAGGELGRADDLVLDMLKQRVAFVVVTPAAELNLPGQLFAVPWSAVQLSGDRLLVPVDPGDAAAIPSFPADKWPDMNDPRWLAQVRAFASPAEPGAVPELPRRRE